MALFNLYLNKIPTDLLFFVLKILIKATLLQKIPEYTLEAASNLKKDNKYYNLIKKGKLVIRKSKGKIAFRNCTVKGKRRRILQYSHSPLFPLSLFFQQQLFPSLHLILMFRSFLIHL